MSGPRPTSSAAVRAAALACAVLAVVAVGGCGGYRSFAQLAADAAAVPVPPGVGYAGERRSLDNGPGFSTAKSEQVVRRFRSTLGCAAVETAWAAALRAAHRHYRIANYPHAFGSVGLLGIEITDRDERLGVTFGDDAGDCSTPFVYAINPPH